jgi:hypothetical protein
VAEREARRDWLLALVVSESDLRLSEIRGRLVADKNFAASISALWRFFDRYGINKKTYGPPRRQVIFVTTLISLRQRIRSQGIALAKMEIRTFQSS